MRTRTFLILGLLVALLLVSSASSAPERTWYWSEEKAETRAAAKVRIPFCLVFDDPRCDTGVYRPDGSPRVGFYGLTEITCAGADERGDTFRYARFKCRFVAGVRLYDYAAGRLLLYPTGRLSFRWKLSSLVRL